MKYVVMCYRLQRHPFDDPGFSCELSGIYHSDRESARQEMKAFGRKEREKSGIDHVWIKEVEEC